MKKLLTILTVMFSLSFALVVQVDQSQFSSASSINVGTSAVKILDSNSQRQYVSFTNNDASAIMYLVPATTLTSTNVVAGVGVAVYPGGGNAEYAKGRDLDYRGEWWAISDEATANLAILEMY